MLFVILINPSLVDVPALPSTRLNVATVSAFSSDNLALIFLVKVW